MKQSSTAKTVISPLHLSSCVSYELSGNRITVRFLGVMPVGSIEITRIRSLRPAARSEVPRLAFALNWMLYYWWQPAYRPIYLLQTGNRKRYFLRLDQSAHKQLLQLMKQSSPVLHTQRKAA